MDILNIHMMLTISRKNLSLLLDILRQFSKCFGIAFNRTIIFLFEHLFVKLGKMVIHIFTSTVS